MNTFYALIKTEEHMLYAHEIAQLYGIYSTTNKPHGRLVKQAILDYLIENNLVYQQYFYNSRHGLKEVFSKNIYADAMERFFKIALENEYKSINNKKYNYQRRNEICHI